MTKEQIQEFSAGTLNLLMSGLLAVILVLPGTGLIKQVLPASPDIEELTANDLQELPPSAETAAEEETGSMLPDGHPVTADLSWLVQALPGQINHLQNRHLAEKVSQGQAICRDLHVSGKSVLVASTSAVSSSLGRQFTLLGAKPSGTG